MSDKFDEAVKEYLQNPIFEWTTQEMIQEELERFARWYEEQQHKEMCAECEYKDKCDTLNSYNPGCLGFVDKHRGTCETCKHGGDCEVQGETFYEGLNKLEKILDEANEKEARGD
jgi:hypothetical protein